eukprot:jgi/Mesen1/3166/ME000184S02237
MAGKRASAAHVELGSTLLQSALRCSPHRECHLLRHTTFSVANAASSCDRKASHSELQECDHQKSNCHSDLLTSGATAKSFCIPPTKQSFNASRSKRHSHAVWLARPYSLSSHLSGSTLPLPAVLLVKQQPHWQHGNTGGARQQSRLLASCASPLSCASPVKTTRQHQSLTSMGTLGVTRGFAASALQAAEAPPAPGESTWIRRYPVSLGSHLDMRLSSSSHDVKVVVTQGEQLEEIVLQVPNNDTWHEKLHFGISRALLCMLGT